MLFAVVWSIRGHGRVCPSIPCPYLHVLLVNHALLSPSLWSSGDPLLRQAFNGLDKSTSLGMPGRLCIPTLGRAIDLASLVDHMLKCFNFVKPNGQNRRMGRRNEGCEMPARKYRIQAVHRSSTKFFYSWDGLSVRMHRKAGTGQGSEEGKRYNLFINHHNHRHKQRSDTKKAFIVVVS